MEPITLIANKGIHMSTYRITIDRANSPTRYFHEWYDETSHQWCLDVVEMRNFDGSTYYHKRTDLILSGLLKQYLDPKSGLLLDDLTSGPNNVQPIKVDADMCDGVPGHVFKMTLSDRHCMLDAYIGKWLPIPYYPVHDSTDTIYPGAYNWARIKLVPVKADDKDPKATADTYDVILAFDTRTKEHSDRHDQTPVFPDSFSNEMHYRLCDDPRMVLDYTTPQTNAFVQHYLFGQAHPDIPGINDVQSKVKMAYIATYNVLVEYLAANSLTPKVTLYRDRGVVIKDVDMVVDIGNSRTTALLVELDTRFNFKDVTMLELCDFTNIYHEVDGKPELTKYDQPFDMRLAFRQVRFGEIPYGRYDRNGRYQEEPSQQFVYPSFVRLGHEANVLMHMASDGQTQPATLSTLSSPKRYLWDRHPNEEEWRFLTFPGERQSHILEIEGLSTHLLNDGSLTRPGEMGGMSFHYSRGSLMQLAFLEMLVQAEIQLNSQSYRRDKGHPEMPRRIRRLIVTCPTAMSKVERSTLLRSANNAVELLARFKGDDTQVKVVPENGDEWHYDEATCSQLVYVYSEIGYKYKGSCQEFFNIYGHRGPDGTRSELTIASLDIGAGTTDLMINKYTFQQQASTTIKPDPQFYDSFYHAGDDMLADMVMQTMFYSPHSALRRAMPEMSDIEYRQRLHDFFGPDYAGQTYADRLLRRDFNMQYSVPLTSYFLGLLAGESPSRMVTYADVFADVPVSDRVIEGVRSALGIDLETLQWEYDPQEVSECVYNSFEPLLKKVAAIIYSYKCDIVLLSGRPASLKPIRDIFLKFYGLSPDRLILLNKHYVGHWYPSHRNTGYITEPKTIVAVGALIGYYASTLNRLAGFTIDKSLLDTKLTSVVKYVEATRETNLPDKYFITPDKPLGKIAVNSLPAHLSVNQIGSKYYPERVLYCVDFNRTRLGANLRAQAEKEGQMVTDVDLRQRVNEKIDAMYLRMPFEIHVEKDHDDNESLHVTEVIDKDGNNVPDNFIEINVQSIGATDHYWLDTGAFMIQ